MIGFLFRRLPWLLCMLLATSVIAFLLPRMAGGDPAVAKAGSDATPEQIASIRTAMGLDRPLMVQYADWLANLLHGDFGLSLITNRPVAQLVYTRLGSTIELTLAAGMLMIALGAVLGLVAGSELGGWGRRLIDGLLSVLLAIPPHVTGLLLILGLGVTWQLLPFSGELSVLRDPARGLPYLVLPALALALPSAATIARLIQTQMQTIREEEYIDLARAKGVPARRITTHHILRNSLGTAVIAIGLRIGDLVAGAVVIEAIFARNGLGSMAVGAVASRDYQVVQILVLFAVAAAMIAHLVSEICLAALDPRIRLENA